MQPMSKDDILDLPEPKAHSKWFNRLFYAAVLLFAYWFAADLLLWPFGTYALFAGLVCFAAVSLIRFIKQRRLGLYQYFYFAGHLSVLSGIGLYLSEWPRVNVFFWIAFGCFGLGLLLLSRKKE